ncbi:restriction endonuclease [Desulforamulus ferrireducens]|uniref:Restriction endonuclease n=1 Tax=Desulforamulus ferrireducens TaxID=1833852 RepID=A0A1S6IWS4_9FIRM|nr:restriction endonuclease [Desulforamulus ferrireducens]AQS59220.1 restriction endonuclease [Desulforamulus ferrireducens]
MSLPEKTFWGIHAGKTGDADNLFLKKNYIALGWARIGDLSKIPADREAFKKKIVEKYPDNKPGSVPVDAGQLYRFVHVMKKGDIVIYPSKKDRNVHLGIVEGEYKYDPSIVSGYPNLRQVRWIKHVPRTILSQGALYEIGAAMSLFQVKNYAEEFQNTIDGKQQPLPVKKDETIALVAEEIEESTRDFILKKLAQELKGHPFAEFVGHLLNCMGYRTRISPEGPDGGIDIVAHKDELGFEPPIIKVQVKSTEGSVGDPIVSALYGKVSPGEYGLLVCLGTFTNQAKNFAKSKSNLRLIDGNDMVDLILQYYEQFDSRYKGLIPLKRVYVPEVIEESNE